MNPIKSLISGLTNKFSVAREACFSEVYSALCSAGVPASVAAVIGELVTGVVMLFVGLFMIDAVHTATALNNTSVFYGISTALISTTGTIFTVLGLVIIVIALATAIGSLKNMF
jgi:hypothetical protein